MNKSHRFAVSGVGPVVRTRGKSDTLEIHLGSHITLSIGLSNKRDILVSVKPQAHRMVLESICTKSMLQHQIARHVTLTIIISLTATGTSISASHFHAARM